MKKKVTFPIFDKGSIQDKELRLVRCLAIAHRLSRAFIHIETLARDYNVTRRTIQRDFEALRKAGFELAYTEFKGCYRAKL